jgi:hypothetical protein
MEMKARGIFRIYYFCSFFYKIFFFGDQIMALKHVFKLNLSRIGLKMSTTS